jgi:hypothetical protein
MFPPPWNIALRMRAGLHMGVCTKETLPVRWSQEADLVHAAADHSYTLCRTCEELRKKIVRTGRQGAQPSWTRLANRAHDTPPSLPNMVPLKLLCRLSKWPFLRLTVLYREQRPTENQCQRSVDTCQIGQGAPKAAAERRANTSCLTARAGPIAPHPGRVAKRFRRAVR